MAENQEGYYQDFGYQQHYSLPGQGSPPPISYQYQNNPNPMGVRFNQFNSQSKHYFSQNQQQVLHGPHHQKQLDLAAKARQESSQHHHARMAANKSRMNMNIMQTNSMGTLQAIQSNQKSLSDPNILIEAGSVKGSNPEMARPTSASAKNTSDWTAIDLGGMMISNLSRAIFQYEFLTCLYLNHNNLRTLSGEISLLKNLTVLNLTGNKFTMLPLEIGLVVSLKELLLFDNQISYLPPELGYLYRLEILGLEGNPMTDPIATMIQKDGTRAVITYLRDICPGIFAFDIFTLVGTPPAEREWIILEEDPQSPTSGGKNSDRLIVELITVMCYNMLSEKYATPQTYAYTPSWALAWDYRKDLLLQDILNYNADIVCLQVYLPM